MKSAIEGKTIQWTFEDGPTAGKTFEHHFDADGSVTFRMLGDGKPKNPNQSVVQQAAPTPIDYQSAQVGDDVFVVTYLSPDSGYTLTAVLDLATSTVVAVASNEHEVMLQHGTFETVVARAA